MRVRLNSVSVAVSLGVLGLVLSGCGNKAEPTAPAASTEVVAAPTPAAAPAPVAAAPAPAVAPVETAAASATSTETPAELPLIFDQLEKPDYKAAYLPLFSGAHVAEWMRTGGTASPGHMATIGGAPYELYSHCKPHDCGDNMMYVAFSRDHRRAWALLLANGVPTYFGNPDADMKAALMAAACKDVQRDGC